MFSLKIVSDPNPSSPRQFMNIGTIYYHDHKFPFGDSFLPRQEITKMMQSVKVIYYPIYGYVGNKTELNTIGYNNIIGSFFNGIIAIDKERIRDLYQVTKIKPELKEKVRFNLQKEVSEYSAYLSGKMYGFEIEREGKLLDFRYGFFSEKDALLNGKQQLEYLNHNF